MINKKMDEIMLQGEKTPDSKEEESLAASQAYAKIMTLATDINPSGYLPSNRSADGVFRWPQFSNKVDAEAFAELAREEVGVSCRLSETSDRASGDTLWQVVSIEAV